MKSKIIIALLFWASTSISQTVYHQIPIAGGGDDAEQEGSFIDVDDIELDLGWSNGEMSRVGLLFRDVFLETGSKTDSACLVFTLQEDFEDTLDVHIRIDKSSKSIGYNDSTELDFNREYLSATVLWKITGGNKGDEIRSPNLQALVNSIMAREGWDETSSLNFLLEPANLSDSLSESEVQLYAFEQHIEARRPTLVVRIDQDQINGIDGATDMTELSIFPNPTDGRVLLTGMKEESIVTIRNATGAQIARFASTSYEMEMDASAFPSGLYIVSVQIENDIRSFRMVKR